MSPHFFSLPRELRDQIYKLVVLQEEPIDSLSGGYGRQQTLTPGLLRANKTVHHEASLLLYTQNSFYFNNATPEDAASFLGHIGRNNADHIRHIYIDFPQFVHLDLGEVSLEDESASVLAMIQNGCANLSTLTTSLDSTNAMELSLDALDYPNLATEALKLVNAHFRTNPSLQEIIVEVYEDGPSKYIREKMKSLGWTISTTKYVEEDIFIESDFEDYDHVYDSGGDYHDDYDIDNDSDFWRRARD